MARAKPTATDDRADLPTLDGLRFFAFLLVFIHHAPRSTFAPFAALQEVGWVGVHVFLALSAYLLTSLLAAERRTTGRISLRRFFVRRALRIWPLYAVFISLALAFAVFRFGPNASMLLRFAGLVFFVDNLASAVAGFNPIPYTAHLWSLSLEEQFYLVLPFLLARWLGDADLLWRRVVQLWACFVGARVLTVVLEAAHPLIWVSVFSADSLLAGTVLGAIRWKPDTRVTARLMLLTGGVGALLTPLVLPPLERTGMHQAVMFASIGIGAALLTTAAIHEPWLRWLGARPLRYLGKISYGLYVWHFAGNIGGRAAADTFDLEGFAIPGAVSFVVTLLLASVSYRLLERPFLALKQRFAGVDPKQAWQHLDDEAPPTEPLPSSRAMKKFAVIVLLAAPVTSLVLNAANWVRYGVDLPFMDDWRPFEHHQAGSLEPAVVFKPWNDTLYPVGIALDSIAHRLLGSHAVAYQLLSMVGCLGALLALQWLLLKRLVGDRFLAAVALTATLPMLAPGSYWGFQNMAYHQALPVVFVLCAFAVMFAWKWHWWLSPLAVLGLGCLAGMSYISGAFGTFACGATLTAIAWRLPEAPLGLRRGGPAMLVAGVATTIPQLWVILGHQHAGTASGTVMATPLGSTFWAYWLGKFGRSLLLPAEWGFAALALTVAALAATAALGVWLVRHRGALGSRGLRLFAGLAGLSATLVVYFSLVAAGRANLRPDSIVDFVDIFRFGFVRFHYFWGTVLWPWALAAVLVALRHRLGARRVAGVAVVLAVLVVASATAAGAFDHQQAYAVAARARVAGQHCIRASMAAASPMRCEAIELTDVRDAVLFAQSHGASFTEDLLPVVTVTSARAGLQAIAIGEEHSLTAQISAPRSGAVTAAGIFAGNNSGRADGVLELRVCSAQRCTAGSAAVKGTIDNDFVTARLDQPLEVAAGDTLTVTMKGSGYTEPLAVWTSEPSETLSPRPARLNHVGRDIDVRFHFDEPPPAR